jgi:hypothetical protein
MPVMPCVKNSRKGFKWGHQGTCYVGPNARELAIAQGRAIKYSESKGKKK